MQLLLPLPPVRRGCTYITEQLYRLAVNVDTFWLKRVIGIELVVHGHANTHPAPIVICNHHCGFDIALLQELISGRGPMLKFLIKKELVWVPIFGWVCLLLDFPRLRRNKFKGDQAKDYQTVAAASKQHGIERNSQRGALLIFPEGTRFSRAKNLQQRSPYKHLLKPKSGGLSIIQQHVAADTPLVDITIDYGQSCRVGPEPSLWSCLHGQPKKIVVHIEHYNLSEIDDIQAWLNRRWQQKDKLLGG